MVFFKKESTLKASHKKSRVPNEKTPLFICWI
jgi:hypothetical protein